MKTAIGRRLALLPLLAALVLAGLWLSVKTDGLVVYCAHDAIYSNEILEEFTRQTGIHVQTRFDTEATKSLGLINLIVQERQHPRCDVFWNNELLGMMELKEQGLLEPYQGSGWNRMPNQFRDADGCWVGFAARLRVYIINSQIMPADQEMIGTMLSVEPGRFAIAKPLFGTTLTHFTVLWHVWGADRLKSWFKDLRLRGTRVVDGNAAVKDLVVMGTCDAGMTDTDDVFVGLDDGHQAGMLPVRVANGDSKPNPQTKTDTSRSNSATICIPNTVGIIKGTQRGDAAKKLVDFLTSAETELALAKAKSRQIPLGPVDAAQLPEDVRNLAEWARDGIDLRSLLPERRECVKWLQTDFFGGGMPR